MIEPLDRRGQPAARRGAILAEVGRGRIGARREVLGQRRRRRSAAASPACPGPAGCRRCSRSGSRSTTIGISSSWFSRIVMSPPETVPRGERRHRDPVEPRDRIDRLAGLDAVADRVDQRIGLAVREGVARRGAAGVVAIPAAAAARPRSRRPQGPGSSPPPRPRAAARCRAARRSRRRAADSPPAARCAAATSSDDAPTRSRRVAMVSPSRATAT